VDISSKNVLGIFRKFQLLGKEERESSREEIKKMITIRFQETADCLQRFRSSEFREDSERLEQLYIELFLPVFPLFVQQGILNRISLEKDNSDFYKESNWPLMRPRILAGMVPIYTVSRAFVGSPDSLTSIRLKPWLEKAIACLRRQGWQISLVAEFDYFDNRQIVHLCIADPREKIRHRWDYKTRGRDD